MRQLTVAGALVLLACSSGSAPPSASAVDAGQTELLAAPRSAPMSSSAPLRLPLSDADAVQQRRHPGRPRGPTLDANSAPADAGHKMAAAVRPPSPTNPSWSIPNWWVDPVAGNDSNTCVTSGAPCKHLYEIVARWGTTTPYLQQLTTITYLSSAPASDPVALAPVLKTDNSNFLIFQGTLTAGTTGTLSTVSAKAFGNPSAAGHPWLATGSFNLAAQIGAFVQDTTRSSFFWVSVATGAGNQVQLTQPLARFDPTFIAYPPAMLDTVAAGDAITIETLPTLSVIGCPGCVVQDFSLIGTGNALSDFTALTVAEATVGVFGISNQSTVNTAVLANDHFPQGGGFTSVQVIGGDCGTGIGPSATFTCSWGGPAFWDGDVLLHGYNPCDPGNGHCVANLAYIDDDLHGKGTGLYVRAYEGLYVSGVGRTWGPGTVSADSEGKVIYQGTGNPGAVSVFLQSGALAGSGVPISCDAGSGFASAYDNSTLPGQWLPHRALTAANLDATIASGGFGNIAYCGSTIVVQYGGVSAPSTTAYVAPVANGGTGVVTCASGAVLEGNGTSPMTCVSPPWLTAPVNLTTQVTNALPVANGGTGVATCASGKVLEGNGTSPMTCVTPPWLTAPVSLTSQITSTLPVGNGGTGIASCGSGQVLEGGGGTAALSCVSPPWLTAPVSLTTQVSNVLPVANGGTNLTGVGAAGQFLVTNAASTAWAPTTISGDLTCSGVSPGNCTVLSLFGVPLSLGSFAAGKALTYNGSQYANAYPNVIQTAETTVSTTITPTRTAMSGTISLTVVAGATVRLTAALNIENSDTQAYVIETILTQDGSAVGQTFRTSLLASGSYGGGGPDAKSAVLQGSFTPTAGSHTYGVTADIVLGTPTGFGTIVVNAGDIRGEVTVP